MFLSICVDSNKKVLKEKTEFSFSEFMDIIHKELLEYEDIDDGILGVLLNIKKKTDLILYKNNPYVRNVYRGIIDDTIFYLKDKVPPIINELSIGTSIKDEFETAKEICKKIKVII